MDFWKIRNYICANKIPNFIRSYLYFALMLFNLGCRPKETQISIKFVQGLRFDIATLRAIEGFFGPKIVQSQI